MKKHSYQLGLDVDVTRTENLRAKLMKEISQYEGQLESLKSNGTYVNFTMIQTYKELIAARKDMLRRLTASY